MPPRLERLSPLLAAAEDLTSTIHLLEVARHDLWSGSYEVQLGRQNPDDPYDPVNVHVDDPAEPPNISRRHATLIIKPRTLNSTNKGFGSTCSTSNVDVVNYWQVFLRDGFEDQHEDSQRTRRPSLNGTFVNNWRCVHETTWPLRHGDVISLGGLSTAKDAVCFRMLLCDDLESIGVCSGTSAVNTETAPARILTRKRPFERANRNRFSSPSKASPADLEFGSASRGPRTQRPRRSILSEKVVDNVPLPSERQAGNNFDASLDTTCLSYMPGSNISILSPFAASASAVKVRQEFVSDCEDGARAIEGGCSGTTNGEHRNHSIEMQYDDSESVQDFEDDVARLASAPVAHSDKMATENSPAEESVHEYDDDEVPGAQLDSQSPLKSRPPVAPAASHAAPTDVAPQAVTGVPKHVLDGAPSETERISIDNGAVNTSSPGESIGDFSLSQVPDPHESTTKSCAIKPAVNAHIGAQPSAVCSAHGKSPSREVETTTHISTTATTRAAQDDENRRELNRSSFGAQAFSNEGLKQSAAALRDGTLVSGTNDSAAAVAATTTPQPSGGLAYVVEWPSALLSGSTQNSTSAPPQLLPPSSALPSYNKSLHRSSPLLEAAHTRKSHRSPRTACDNHLFPASTVTVEGPHEGATSYQTESIELLPTRTDVKAVNLVEPYSVSRPLDALCSPRVAVATTCKPRESETSASTNCPSTSSVGKSVGVSTGITNGNRIEGCKSNEGGQYNIDHSSNRSVSFISGNSPVDEPLTKSRSDSGMQRKSLDDILEPESTDTEINATPLPQRIAVFQASKATKSQRPEHVSEGMNTSGSHHDSYFDSLGSRSHSIGNSSSSLTAETPVLRVGLLRSGHGGSLGGPNAPDSCEDSLIIGGTQTSQLAGLARIRGANETQITQDGGHTFSLDGDIAVAGNNSRNNGRELGAVSSACVCGLPPDAVVGTLVPNTIAQPQNLQAPLHWLYQPGINRALSDMISFEGKSPLLMAWSKVIASEK